MKKTSQTKAWRAVLRFLVVASMCVTAVFAQNVDFDDETAGEHIDTVAYKGIQLKNMIHTRFTAMLQEVTDQVNSIQQTMDDHLGIEAMPNLTTYMTSKLTNVTARLQDAEDLLSTFNLTEKEAVLPVYYAGSTGVVNVGESYSTTDNQFTAARDAVYLICVKSDYGYSINIVVKLNSATTLLSLTSSTYYRAKVLCDIRWLDKYDNITVSGTPPDYFMVVTLHKQTLMPNSMP